MHTDSVNTQNSFEWDCIFENFIKCPGWMNNINCVKFILWQVAIFCKNRPDWPNLSQVDTNCEICSKLTQTTQNIYNCNIKNSKIKIKNASNFV